MLIVVILIFLDMPMMSEPAWIPDQENHSVSAGRNLLSVRTGNGIKLPDFLRHSISVSACTETGICIQVKVGLRFFMGFESIRGFSGLWREMFSSAPLRSVFRISWGPFTLSVYGHANNCYSIGLPGVFRLFQNHIVSGKKIVVNR